VGSTEGQRLTAVAVGKQSEVADLHETGRQDMEQEAAHELDRVELHDAAAVVMPGVPPAEAHPSILKNILARGYLAEGKKTLIATDLGRLLIDSLNGKFRFVEYDYTIELEQVYRSARGGLLRIQL